ncbi:hypothetical protein [Nioella aestuarii]|uniref:hypothetical protein n=1 Tax=Nioella aestuarii TaxID=1662864 RepID=UPI003D7FBA7D
MRPIFTIHAGEFVFGEAIEKLFPSADLWIPAKDRGIDFLITVPGQEKSVSVQVKMSRDYSNALAKTEFDKRQLAGGWFKFSHEKIANSPAEIWSLILISRSRKTKPMFVNIRPDALLDKLETTHGVKDSYDLYPWILKMHSKTICVEGRGLKKDAREQIACGERIPESRDWTEHFEDWDIFNLN